MALHFISGKNKGKEFALRQGRDLIIGRTGEGELLVDDPQAPNKQAIISVFPEKIWIRDLHSENGIFVNGEKIGETQLKEGDRIRISGERCMLVSLNRFSASYPSTTPKPSGEAPRPRGDTGFLIGRRTIAGSLQEMSLVDLLQFLSNSQKSGVLKIKSENEIGKVYLREGHIYHAIINDNSSVNAVKSLYRIMRWRSGSFELAPNESIKLSEELPISSHGLLLEGARQVDEIARIEAHLPPKKSALAPAKPLPVRLREFTPEELDIYQLVVEHGTLEGVLDYYPGNDLEALTHLQGLLRRKIIINPESKAHPA